jgi:hypothetical protein
MAKININEMTGEIENGGGEGGVKNESGEKSIGYALAALRRCHAVLRATAPLPARAAQHIARACAIHP